ncbi:MAG: TerB N-terminal domain-containing protein [Caldiserica bacterium]|jgi:hypothetical protein|nr:TerB N-terminal domain-containing protein [Caldisericota bacterium]MDH7563155.1 TerB N-terminal domain-containing protein [Caldisericota bacterium]
MSETSQNQNRKNFLLVRTERLGVGEIWALPISQVGGESKEPRESPLPLIEYQEEKFKGGIRLTPDEVIRKGSARLKGLLEEDDFPTIDFPVGDGEELPALFFEFLVHWGFPGGVVGGYEVLPKAASFLEQFLRANPGCQVMVTGPKRSLAILGDFLKKSEGVFLLSPNEVEEWKGSYSLSFLLILDAEQGVNYATPYFFSLLKIPRRISFAQFNSKGFLRTSKKEALSKIFGVSYYSVIWDFCILDRNSSFFFQPRSYSFLERQPISLTFAEFTLKDGSTLEVTIPPKAQVPQVVSLPPGKSFLEEGEALASREGEKAEFVPFRKYFPTYSDLSDSQLRWYLFWRTQARKGEYLETDLSYLFLFSYELINCIGQESPFQGYQKLKELWRNYREDFPRLDNYLIDWIVDFSIVYSCPVNPLETYKEALNFGVVKNPDLLIEEFLRDGAEEIPLVLLEELSFYKFLKSPFFKKFPEPEVAERFRRAFWRIDDFFKESTNSGIFEKFRPPSKIKVRRFPFQGALWGKEKLEMITLGEAHPYSRFSPLANFFTSIFKEIENCLREKYRFPGRLGDSGLPPDIRRFIREAIFEEIPRPHQPRRVDEEVVRRLLKESEEVRELIQRFSSSRDYEVTQSSGEELPNSFPEAEEAPFPGVSSEWRLFAGRLKPFQREVLRALLKEDDPIPLIVRISRENGIMPEALLDSLNEISLEAVGDLILDGNSTPPVIFEENRDIIKQILSIFGEDERS